MNSYNFRVSETGRDKQMEVCSNDAERYGTKFFHMRWREKNCFGRSWGKIIVHGGQQGVGIYIHGEAGPRFTCLS